MVRVEASTVINVALQEVWEFLSDLETQTQWGSGVLKVEYQRPVGIGTRVVVTAQLFGRRTADETITEWVPNRKLGIEGRSVGSRFNVVYAMEQVEGTKTRLTRSAQAETIGLFKLLQPYVSYRVKKENAVVVSNVKRILEGQNKNA